MFFFIFIFVVYANHENTTKIYKSAVANFLTFYANLYTWQVYEAVKLVLDGPGRK